MSAELVGFKAESDIERAWVRLGGSNFVVPGVVLVNADGTAVDPAATQTQGFAASFSFTPAAAAYLANDVIDVAKQASAALGPAGGGEVLITSLSLEVDASALISGQAGYNLQLYNITPPSAHVDNDAWDLPSGDRAAHICTLGISVPVDLGSTLKIEVDGINKQVTMPAGSRPFAELVTVGAFTATATLHKVILHTAAL